MREVESCEVSEGRVQEVTNSSVSGLHMTEVEALQQHTACGGRRGGGGEKEGVRREEGRRGERNEGVKEREWVYRGREEERKKEREKVCRKRERERERERERKQMPQRGEVKKREG